MQQCTKEELGLLGELGPGEKKLEGKSFYLDGVKKRSTALLLEAISLHGGVGLFMYNLLSSIYRKLAADCIHCILCVLQNVKSIRRVDAK